MLLDYACCNGGGYCQEYLDITSAIVKVVGNDEKLAVDVRERMLLISIPITFPSSSSFSSQLSLYHTLKLDSLSPGVSLSA